MSSGLRSDTESSSSVVDYSDDEQDSSRTRRHIQWADIPTVGELYKKGDLQPDEAPKFPYRDDLLEKVSVFQGDITRLDLDAIVNAANKSLLGGGGVDGAIHSAAGPKLLEECRGLNGCLTGQSKITRGYNLPSHYVIHTVGPVYNQSPEKAALLASCYKTSLKLAVDNSLRQVAFPSISTGVYGYPIVDATRIALHTVRQFLESDLGSKVDRVIFVVWSDRDHGVYRNLIPEYFPGVVSKEPSQDQSEGVEDQSGKSEA
ncbi:hypothetical protein AX16_010189 [Volvariella volvacea WC 439]|nr:hypothetical protein AX16_010189 [Volvariella volvacea WC 439]